MGSSSQILHTITCVTWLCESVRTLLDCITKWLETAWLGVIHPTQNVNSACWDTFLLKWFKWD